MSAAKKRPCPLTSTMPTLGLWGMQRPREVNPLSAQRAMHTHLCTNPFSMTINQTMPESPVSDQEEQTESCSCLMLTPSRWSSSTALANRESVPLT